MPTTNTTSPANKRIGKDVVVFLLVSWVGVSAGAETVCVVVGVSTVFSGDGVSEGEGVGVCVEVSVGNFLVAVGVNVRVGVSVEVTSVLAVSLVDVVVTEGVSSVVVEVTVTVCVGVSECGSEVSVGFGGGWVVGGGLGVSVAGCWVGVREGTVPCERGIAQTTGSIEKSVNNIKNSKITACVVCAFVMVLPSQVTCIAAQSPRSSVT